MEILIFINWTRMAPLGAVEGWIWQFLNVIKGWKRQFSRAQVGGSWMPLPGRIDLFYGKLVTLGVPACWPVYLGERHINPHLKWPFNSFTLPSEANKIFLSDLGNMGVQRFILNNVGQHKKNWWKKLLNWPRLLAILC